MDFDAQIQLNSHHSLFSVSVVASFNFAWRSCNFGLARSMLVQPSHRCYRLEFDAAAQPPSLKVGRSHTKECVLALGRGVLALRSWAFSHLGFRVLALGALRGLVLGL